ncbi:MAG TPA: sugar ABC transporter permease [Candidatus Limnocylindria bacterium]|jgi:multiple sugar transport system permease protein
MAGRSAWKQGLTAWSFALPYVLLFLVFMAGPILVSLVTSFTDLRVTDIRNPLNVEFIGLDNYLAVLSDGRFQKAAANTAVFVIVGVPLTLALGLAAAVGLNQGVVKFRTLFRVGFYLPVVTSIVAIAVVWRLLLGTEVGLINATLGMFGIDGPGWLSDERYALWSIITMAAWRNLGFVMVIFLAGLQGIPRDLYEAAEVDGANRWQRFRGITLPLLRPTLLFAAVITGIGYVQYFEEVYVMTEGGPLYSTASMAFYAYDQFSFGNYGYTAATSFVVFIAIAFLTLVQFRLLRSDD